MTKPIDPNDLVLHALGGDTDLLSRLLLLLDRVQVDPASGTLSLVNGAARLDLHKDGRIRVAGSSITQISDRDITLHAAWIDLN